MENFWQRDPRWREVEIRPSRQTIGRVGCTICSIADISSYLGATLTPVDVMRTAMFTDDARIIWLSCKFPHFYFVRREYDRDDASINAAMADPDQGVIFEVAGGSHWVAPVRWSWLQNCWTIKDPWTGSEDTMRKYGNEITGTAYFRRYPTLD